MNSINDILSQKADNIFKTPSILTTVIENNDPKNENSVLDTEELKKMLYSLKDQVEMILRIVDGQKIAWQKPVSINMDILKTGERIIEGVFNGEKMIGSDGAEYGVPPNYASKSKIVEGDLMKLTITNNGSFIYKQIGPIERNHLVGELVGSPEGQWSVLANGKTYKILTASVTFYRGKAGDETIILVPKGDASDWAAVDNIIHK